MKRISDKITQKNKIISIKNNRLHIYKRKGSNFWQGRMFLNDTQIVKSSGKNKIAESVHDLSSGGLIIGLAEMSINSNFGIKIGLFNKNDSKIVVETQLIIKSAS